MTEVASMVQRFSDRCSAILIKEVRQAVRGKSFRITFVATLTLAAVVALVTIVSMGRFGGNLDGRGFFVAMHNCLAIALLWFVPFSAYQAMAAEWTENTFDLLVISNLKPRQIVGGKWLASMVQAGLYVAAFLPFLVLSFLLRGVDLLGAATSLIWTLTLCGGLTYVALFLSTFARRKALQVFLLAALVGVTVPATTMSMAYSTAILRMPGQLRDDEFLLVAATAVLGILVVATYCFLGACVSLAHPEENRSTGLRLASTGTVLLGFVLLTLGMRMSPDREALSGISMFLMAAVALPGLFFVTEPEALGRRVTTQIPRRARHRWLVFPFLPGGGRGVALVTLQLGMILAFIAVGQMIMFGHGPRVLVHREILDDGFAAAILFALYLLVALLPLSSLMSRERGSKGRVGTRVWIPFLMLLAWIGPGLFGLLIGDDDLMDLEHPANPAWLIDRTFSRPDRAPGLLMLYGVLAAIAMAVNLGRVRRGWKEMREAAQKARSTSS